MGKVIGITQSYSGDLVQFSTVKGGDITSLNVPISPEQDLHGYASPWGPGGGKNIANYADCVTASTANAEVTILDSQNGFNVKTKTTGIYRGGQIANMTFSEGVTYTLSADIEITSGTAALAFRKKSGTALISYSGAITQNGHYYVSHTFTAADADDCRLSFFATYTTSEDGDVTFSNVMLEIGSTATSFAPYENVCPISGRTSLSAYRTGKNLLPKSTKTDGVYADIATTFNSDGSITLNGTSTGLVNINFPASGILIDVPAGNYILSGGVNNRVYMTFYDGTDSTGTRYDNTSGDTPVTITSGHIYNMRLVILNATTVDNLTIYPMLRPAGTNNTFAPIRKKDTYAVNWHTQVGEVYGGTLGVVSGVLTVDKANIPSYNGETINEPWLSSMDAYSPGATPTIGAQVVYPIADPIEYQLSASQISALTGHNTVWASNGENITLSVLVPATGFNGWLIKAVTNGVGVEIPLKYMRAETYSVTPDQRMEWSAERDVTGVLHRETVQNLPPKIEFNTPLMANSDINALNSIIRAAFTNELQRNITIQFYDPERDEYWEWDCYMPDVKYQIRNVDAANHIINYEETRYAFIGY